MCSTLQTPWPTAHFRFWFGLVAVVYGNENALYKLKEFCTILTWKSLFEHVFCMTTFILHHYLCFAMILLHWKSVWDHCHRENNPMVVLGGQKSDYKICVLIDEISNTAGWISKNSQQSPVLQILKLVQITVKTKGTTNFHVWIHCSIVM